MSARPSHFTSFAATWLSGLMVASTDDIPAQHDHDCLADEALFIQVQAGDTDALNCFIQRHSRLVYACIRHRVWDTETIDDLFQETWMRFIERCHTWKPGVAVKPWLYRVTLNVINDHGRHSNAARRGGTSVKVDMESAEKVSSVNGSPATSAMQSAERTELHRAVMRLQEPFGEVVRLRYLEELSVAEVAEVLNCAEGTVKSRLARGLALLQKDLESGL